MKDKESEVKQINSNIDNNCIFSKENVNLGHQPEFDYVKALCVFLTIITHVYLNYSLGCIWKIIYFFDNIFTAGTFMLLMGIGMKYSRHQEPKKYFSRGIGLLTVGQLLNIIRDCLPNLIAWWITGNKNYISRALLVLQADILIFAGISFLFLAIINKMKLSDGFILIVSIIMNLVTDFLYKNMKSPNNYLLSQFLGYFILTNAEAYFPFCSYFIFVAFGYWFGGYFQKVSNKNEFYNYILIFFLPIMIIFHYFRMNYDFLAFIQYTTLEWYCLMPAPVALLYIIGNLTASAIFYKIDKMLGGKTPKFITKTAQNLNQYYIIRYGITIQMNIFVSVTKGEKYPSEMKYPTLFTIILYIVCMILIDMNDKYIHFSITTLKNKKIIFVFSLIWIMTIICVIYIYPKVEIFANMWNEYLNEE